MSNKRVELDRMWRNVDMRRAFEADMALPTSEGPDSLERDFRVWGAGLLNGREAAQDAARAILAALKELDAASAYVRPFAGTVAADGKLKSIRQAMQFSAAVEKASTAIAQAEAAGITAEG